MLSRFVVHRHRTGRTHFDLRIRTRRVLRSWSLLREPPLGKGQKRLAIERESFTPDSIDCRIFEEEAFGIGKVRAWDSGEVDIREISPQRLACTFQGEKLTGDFELRRMRWYPGNRWMMTKTG